MPKEKEDDTDGMIISKQKYNNKYNIQNYILDIEQSVTKIHDEAC